jgi:transposase
MSAIKILITMAKTLESHQEGILTWYDHRISSGQMEGTNNKIGNMKCQAYRYRDMEFFELKILSIHEAK